MNASQRKSLGWAALLLAAILFFVAWERNAANAANVQAMNEMGAGALFGGGAMEPAMPASAKYALFFGALSAVGGVVLLAGASKSDS